MPLVCDRKIFIIGGMLLLFLALCGCGQPAEIVEQSQAISVETAEAQLGEISQHLSLSGQIIPETEVYIVPKVPGVVSRIHIEMGDTVKEGQLLFTLENSEYLAQLNQAKSGYELAKKAQNDAEKNYSRMQALYDEGAVSLVQLEQAKLNWEASDTSAAAAGLALAQSAYENTLVKAPMSGQVAQLDLVEGGIASQSAPALRLVETRTVKLEISISETYISKIAANQKVGVVIPSLDGAVFEGEINSIAPAADPRTMSFPAEITLNNAEGQLKPGMFAQAEILLEKAENVVVIPKEAVISTMGLSRVFVAEGEIAHLRDVTLGLESETQVEIVSGLSPGELVVTRGNDKLQEGAEIIIRQP